MVFDLDTYKCLGAIPSTGGHGAAVDPKTHHGFSSSSPVSMFDTTTMQPIKKITTEGARTASCLNRPPNGFISSAIAPPNHGD